MAMEENGNQDLGRINKYRRVNVPIAQDYDASSQIHQSDRSKCIKKYVLACACFASLNSVLLGYDVGVMSGAIIFIQEDLNISDVQIEILVGILSIVSILGSLAGGKTSDAIGRKWTMALAAIVFQIGAIIMTVSNSFGMLLTGRLLAGIGIGFGVMIAPVYIAEISPATQRGSLTSFPEIFINFGILLGYISNYAFAGISSHKNWRIMLGVGILPSVFIGFALFIIPESPRWLVVQNRVEEARIVLSKTIDNEAQVEEKLAEIQVAARNRVEGKAVWREILKPSPAVFRMLVAGVGIQCLQQLTGIDTLVYYSPAILKEAGIDNNKKLIGATVGVGITKTVFILVAIFLIDKVGRKPLLYISTIGMTFCLLFLGFTLSFMKQGNAGIVLSILLICGDVAFFSLGIGPISWVVSSEIYPLRLRAQAVALGATGNRICSGVIAMTFLSFTRAISMAGAFFSFSVISALSVVFVFTLIPETKGKTLEEIELMFQNKHQPSGAEFEMGHANSSIQNGQSA